MKAKKNFWYYYRLGDMVRARRARVRSNGRKLHYKLYPTSIASQYMRETNKNNNFDVLINLVREYPLNLKLERDELVVHLRVGDVMREYTAEEYLEKQRVHRLYTNSPKEANYKKEYVRPLSYYIKVVHEVQSLPRYKNISKVVLVAGGCKTSDFTNSHLYIDKIKEFFEESGFNVRTRFGYPPDEDFVFMCYTKFFIQSGGGFSALIKDVRKRLINE